MYPQSCACNPFIKQHEADCKWDIASQKKAQACPGSRAGQAYSSKRADHSLFACRPVPLVPCSGMLPGYVSGFYDYDDCHVDLARLSRFANARFIHAEARSIDTPVHYP